MAKFKQLGKRGFTLVELMIVVVIIGILAALAIYGVQKYVTNSKSAEARQMVGKISKDAQSRWEGENMAGTTVVLGETADTSNFLCQTALLVPLAIQAEGEKYQPDNVTANTDFNSGNATTGWKCLKFTIDSPIYFAYGYASDSAGTSANPGTYFTASGQADFGGVGKQIFLNGKVQTGQLTLSPSLCEVDTATALTGVGTAVVDDAGDCVP